MDAHQVYIDYVMACSRGMLQGFTQGFYNTPKFTLSKNCMDSTFDNDMTILYENTMGGNKPNYLQVFSLIYQVQY